MAPLFALTRVRLVQKGAPQKPTDPADEASGWIRGGSGAKIHVRCEGKGKPVTFVLAPGQRHDATVFEQLMERGSIKRAGRGRPRHLPGRIVGDKGHSFNSIRRYLRRKGINYTIPRKSNQTRTGPFDKAIYRAHNRVERLIDLLKHNRRIATRYDKRAGNYRSFLTSTAILLRL